MYQGYIPAQKKRTEGPAQAQGATHAQRDTAQQGACNNYGQRYRGCACCLMDTESLMIRRPFGSIDPNSIRETELHTECRRRRERESLHSPQHATSITLLLLLKLQEQKTIKSSTEKQGSAFIVHKPNRTATST